MTETVEMTCTRCPCKWFMDSKAGGSVTCPSCGHAMGWLLGSDAVEATFTDCWVDQPMVSSP